MMVWEMNMRGNESMESRQYPERPGEQDCTYYIRTGLCRFGMTCRFNHPPNRKLAVAAARIKGVYPERIGQPECQYYLKTGTCKFGATCKFHHPRDKAGIAGRVVLNILGYPLRPVRICLNLKCNFSAIFSRFLQFLISPLHKCDQYLGRLFSYICKHKFELDYYVFSDFSFCIQNEKECAYYLRTGQCKFGNTCKFHHPQPSNAMVSLRGSPVYPPVHSPSTPGQQSYQGVTNWALSRTSFIPSPRWQGPSSYTQVILPQGVVPVPSWNAYTGQIGSISSSERQQQTPGNNQYYGTPRQSQTSHEVQGLYNLQRDNVFPERPGQPECQFYMKTGDCKYGTVCRFHHPRERLIPVPNCLLSPLGLPLRPGEPLCIFYSRYGICKFGPNCKFDHPMGPYAYNLSSSASADIPVVRRLLGSSSGISAVPLSLEGPVEAVSGKSR